MPRPGRAKQAVFAPEGAADRGNLRRQLIERYPADLVILPVSAWGLPVAGMAPRWYGPRV